MNIAKKHIFATGLNLKQPFNMKKILFTMLCTAIMISCCGNKTKSEGCGDCTGKHTECAQQHSDCTGDCDDCTQQCADKHEGCKSACDKKVECDAPAGCIQVDNEMFMTRIADFNNPEWKYLGDKPAIVDFYADWCGPCKAIAPSLDEIAKEHAGNLYVYKVNVDNSPEIAGAFKISAIPTLLFIPVNGEPVKTVGMIDKSGIEANITKIMQ